MRQEPGGSADEILAALHRSDGTVTEFLEHLAAEPVDADILSQDVQPVDRGDVLGLGPSAGAVDRTALLTGRFSGRVFVYAESTIAMDRLPEAARHRLLSSRDPIGRVLTQLGLDVRRAPRTDPGRPEGRAELRGDVLAGSVLSRSYEMTVGGDLAIVVSEWFLETVVQAARSQRSSPPAGSRLR